MDKIPGWAKSLKFWMTTVVALFALYAGATAIGLDIPRWTWISEHRALAGEVKSDRVHLYQGKVESLERRHTSAIISRSKAKKGSDLHSLLLSKERRLERQLEDAKAILKKVRGF